MKATLCETLRGDMAFHLNSIEHSTKIATITNE